MTGEAEQAGIDAQDRAEDLRAEALNLLASHPAEYRADLEDRLLSMSTEDLRAYLQLRREAALSFFQHRDRAYYEPYADLGPVPEELVEIAEYDHDHERDGIDPRVFGNEVDHPWREAS